jgi:hypothetical protein
MRVASSLAGLVAFSLALGFAACGPIGSDGSSSAGDDASGDDGGGGPGSNTVQGGSFTDQAAPNGYHVMGNIICDSNGAPHVFHGVDRPSLEWSSIGDHLSQSDYALMATAWKANVVRIAMNQDFWLQGSPMYDASYAQTVDQQIQWAEAAGLDVILDLHWSDKGDFTTVTSLNPGAQQRMADANSVTFWQEVATKYQGDGRVMFELYNEPHDIPWGIWLGGGASGNGFTVAGMQQLHDTVRGTGAENLVFIGGLQYAYDLSGVPQNAVQGHNIVYATHPYNQPNKQPGNWDAAFGNLTSTFPVMATEFGDSNTTCATDYYSEFIPYADAHNMSWSGWAWYPADCKFPSLVVDWNGTPSAAGAIEQAALLAY